MTNKFSQAVCERIGYYVYLLKEPNGKIFYIGKGKDNRIFQHVSDSIKKPIQSDKLEIIRKIGSNKVEYFILRHGLSELQALEIESACIELLGLDNLSNEIKGHGSWDKGLKTIDEVIQHYDANAITINEPAIIININRLYNRFMTPKKLYDTTRSSWIVGHKRNKALYAIAAYRGLVREVYKIDNNGWKAINNRWEFTGEIAESCVRDKYLNQSLKKYIRKGGQNPIRYTFK